MLPAKPTSASISEYYDSHATGVQERVGVNIRHRAIMRRLLRAGLRSNHHVLEIGCGVGTLTGLLAKQVTSGSIMGADISAKAVELARAKFSTSGHVSFQVNDMSNFQDARRFDMIVLPDVLEHIPLETHDSLFRTLAEHLAPDGRVCVNIPDPYALDWLRRERPEALQILDQSLAIEEMTTRAAQVGLLLQRFERYALWTKEPDYNWIEFGFAPQQLAQTKLPYFRAVLRELWSRRPW